MKKNICQGKSEMHRDIRPVLPGPAFCIVDVCFNCGHNKRDQGTRKVAVILQSGHELYLKGSVGSRAKAGSHSAKPFCKLLELGATALGMRAFSRRDTTCILCL